MISTSCRSSRCLQYSNSTVFLFWFVLCFGERDEGFVLTYIYIYSLGPSCLCLWCISTYKTTEFCLAKLHPGVSVCLGKNNLLQDLFLHKISSQTMMERISCNGFFTGRLSVTPQSSGASQVRRWQRIGRRWRCTAWIYLLILIKSCHRLRGEKIWNTGQYN